MGIRSVLLGFRQLIEAILSVSDGLKDLVDVIREVGPDAARLEALELSRHQFEARCEGEFLKAEGKLKAANNSEARERQLKRANERHADTLVAPGDEIAEPEGDPVLALDAPGRTTEGLPAVRVGVAAGPKAGAIRAKWSG